MPATLIVISVQMPHRDIQSVINALSDSVILIDSRRRIVLANSVAATRFGQELRGQDFVHAIRDPVALGCVDRVIAGEQSAETLIKTVFPVRSTLKVSVVRLEEAADGEIGAVVTITDVSHVFEAEQMRSDFIANVSHELRSPLTSLKGIIDTLEGTARDDIEARYKFLQIMGSEAERMDRLIDDLLSLSKVEAYAHVRPKGKVDVDRVIKQVVATVRSRLNAKQPEIRTAFSESLVPVNGDEDQLTQVFHNLIENAFKYGRDDAPIEILVEVLERAQGIRNGVVAVSVKDKGPGIEPRHIPRLTERFYRVDAGRSRDQGGTGLGLAIVKHIVNRHLGRFQIESEIGVGSTFTVFLPIA